jgi:uncharacterized membrane protein
MRRRLIITWSISGLLTALFVLAGMATLLDQRVAARLADYNLPSTVRNGIGLGEIAAGVALLIPAVAWQVAACLALAMAITVLTQLFEGQSWPVLLPAMVAGMLSLLVYLRHPRSSLLLRVRAAADAFAERELALEKSIPAAAGGKLAELRSSIPQTQASHPPASS